MSTVLKRLSRIKQAANLAGMVDLTRGIEKESLRVKPGGTLATSPHPKAMGSALTHPHITTDYSEALLEFITEPSQNIHSLIHSLNELHTFTYQHIGSESLWVNSMPCMLTNDIDIPIARYGNSNSGKMKSIYRLGLGHRYGRSMQTIAGIHFNFSLSDTFWQFLHTEERSDRSLQDFKTEGYFKLIRNFRRYFWLLLYLYGAAPAVCRSFVKGREHGLSPVEEDAHTLHTPYATSLRMGDLGYQSTAQESLVLTYNDLDSYTQALCRAITQPHGHYREIGIKNDEGYQQLNDCLLQIENEFYSVIRPKRTAQSGQTALSALSNGGVEYIEVRCLDLNPFEPLGISENQMRFIDCFLLFCLLEDSPRSDKVEASHLQENQKRMVYHGRDPELKLFHSNRERKAQEWAQELLQNIHNIAEVMDLHHDNKHYQHAVDIEIKKQQDPSLTPSAQILDTLKAEQLSFYNWAMKQSLANRQHFQTQSLEPEVQKHYQNMAHDSLQAQQAIENTHQKSFTDYLEDYYKQYSGCSRKLENA